MSAEDGRFNMEGGSCTNNISWVRCHVPVLPPIGEASSLFRERILAKTVPADGPCYRDALFQLLIAETSCRRYSGEGSWTDYGAELAGAPPIS